MRLQVPLFLAITMAFPASLSAQTCESVYRDAVRDLSFTQNDYTNLHSVFDYVCTSSGEVIQANYEASVSLFSDILPIDLTGSGGTSQQKTENFCRNYRSVRYSTSHAVLAKSTVVGSALASYNDCKRIEKASRGIVITHSFANPDAVAIKFTFPNATSRLRIEGVAATNMTCRTPEFATLLRSGDLDETSTFVSEKDFSILCTRPSIKVGEHDTEYLPGTITIATNHDAYTISLPQDRVYNNHLASEATRKITDLQSALVTQIARADELSKFADRIKAMKVDIHAVITGSAHPGGGGKWYPCNQDMEVVKRELCQGAVSSSHHSIGTASGGACGYHRMAVVCVRY